MAKEPNMSRADETAPERGDIAVAEANRLHASNTHAQAEEADNRRVMVDVDHVSMMFNMANEQLNSLKEYFIKLFRRELFFKEFIALDDISFTVREGDVYGIVGTNGSGKSTMLKIVAGVLEPSKGTCTISGRIAPLIELGAGFDLELTARENIYLNGALLGYSKSYIADHFDEIVEFAELRDFLDLPMKNYSSGMVARIAFAIATIIVPDILIVDEALSVGDVFFQEKCERRIKSLIHDHGTTVLFVSHSIEQVERICKRAIWIEKGHKVMEGDVHEVCAAYRSMGYVDYACGNGIMDRTREGSYDTRDDATYAELRRVLSRIGAPESVSRLADGPADDAPVAREDACTVIRAFAASRRPSVAPLPEHAELGAFFDTNDADPAKLDDIAWCVGHGLIAGTADDDGRRLIEPKAALMRVALAKMIAIMYRQVLAYPDDVAPTSSIAVSGNFDYAIEHDIMHGYMSGLFGPNDGVTRMQVAMVMWRCAGRPDVSAQIAFPDVADDAYFRDQVVWAVDEGLMKPYGHGLFAPEEAISFADFVPLVRAFCERMGATVPEDALAPRTGKDSTPEEGVSRVQLLAASIPVARELEARA